jgi:hypothetical protein
MSASALISRQKWRRGNMGISFGLRVGRKSPRAGGRRNASRSLTEI